MSAPLRLRSLARSLSTIPKNLIKEPHPFFIHPTTVRPQPVSLKFYTSRLGRAASMYIPIYVGFFGWSLAWAKLSNWNNGVEGNPWEYGNRELKGLPPAQL